MKRPQFTHLVAEASASGTFLTAKHDPSSIGTSYPGYRSITVEPASGIAQFFAADAYTVREHEDSRGQPYFEVTPTDPNFVAGSGIPPAAGQPDRPCDRLVVVSGVRLGWHVFAEDSAAIAARRASGDLIDCGEF